MLLNKNKAFDLIHLLNQSIKIEPENIHVWYNTPEDKTIIQNLPSDLYKEFELIER